MSPRSPPVASPPSIRASGQYPEAGRRRRTPQFGRKRGPTGISRTAHNRTKILLVPRPSYIHHYLGWGFRQVRHGISLANCNYFAAAHEKVLLKQYRRVKAPTPDAPPSSAALLVHRLRSEEHTSELQSLRHLVCRLL